MAAVLGLPDAEVERLCAEAQDVWPANYNCPGQLVISGREAGVSAVCRAGEASWAAKVIRLRVVGRLPQPAGRRCRAPARAGRCGRSASASWATRFMSTVSSKLETVDRVPGLLVEQLTAPVRFTQAVQGLVADGVAHVRRARLGLGAGRAW